MTCHPNPESMLASFVEVFSGFWSRDRLLVRRIHGIARLIRVWGGIERRNRRRQGAAARVIGALEKHKERGSVAQRSAILYAITSFEFFDVLAEACDSAEECARLLFAIAEQAV